MGGLCLAEILWSGKFVIKDREILRFTALMSVVFIYIFATGINVKQYLVSFCGVFLCFYIYSIYLYKENRMGAFLQALSDIMLLIATTSLFLWLFGSVLRILPGRTQLSYYWADEIRTTYTYYLMYFENPVQNAEHGALCNLGVWTEAPGYASFLIYAFLVEFGFMMEAVQAGDSKGGRISAAKILIFLITLVTSRSSKGLLVIGAVAFLSYILLGEINRKTLMRKLLVSGGLCAVVALLGYRVIINKFLHGSGKVRFDHMQAAVKAWLENPIFGVGYQNASEILKHRVLPFSNDGLSMGLTVLLAFGGLWLIGLYIGAVDCSFHSKYFTKYRKTWVVLFAVLLINVIISNCSMEGPYIFLIASSYAAPQAERRRITLIRYKEATVINERG